MGFAQGGLVGERTAALSWAGSAKLGGRQGRDRAASAGEAFCSVLGSLAVVHHTDIGLCHLQLCSAL